MELLSKENVINVFDNLIKEEEMKRQAYYDLYIKQLTETKNTIRINDEYIHKLCLVLQEEDLKLNILRQIKFIVEKRL